MSNNNNNTIKEEIKHFDKESTNSSSIWFDEVKLINSNDQIHCDWKPLPKRDNRKNRQF